MGFSKSPSVVRKYEHRLARLASGGIVTWEEPSPEDAERWAYKIRECFSIIRRNTSLFPELARAAIAYRIETHECTVRAVPKVAEPDWSPVAPRVASPHPSARQEAVAPAAHPLESPTVEQVIQFWIDRQPSAEPIQLYNCEFTNSELRQLAAWAAAMEPAWYVALDAPKRLVTIQPNEPELEQVVSP